MSRIKKRVRVPVKEPIPGSALIAACDRALRDLAVEMFRAETEAFAKREARWKALMAWPRGKGQWDVLAV